MRSITAIILGMLAIAMFSGCGVVNIYEQPGDTGLLPQKRYPELTFIDNPEVRYYLGYYSGEARKFVTDSNKRKEPHEDMVRSLLSSQGVPETLVSVAVVESGFRADAKSPAGAGGIWQFMPDTAKYYGLNVGLFQDERFDISRSTTAAARYFGVLYDKFNDWYLAIAAYNAGPMTVQRAIEQYKTRDFFQLCRLGAFNKESSAFVAKVLAIALIQRNPQLYGFEMKTDTKDAKASGTKMQKVS